MVTMSMRQPPSRRRQKGYGDQERFLARVTKTLHYNKYPKSNQGSLPVTEFAAEIFSRAKGQLSLDLLDVEEAARLTRNTSVSPCSLVLALLYLDRLKASNPKYLASVPPSQLFLISLMVGSKFLQDDGQEDEVNTCEWATHSGLTTQDINRAEKEFLHAIDWEVFVSEEQFWRTLEGMERLIGLREGCKRGWFSYTDLDLLLASCPYTAIVKHIINVMLLCAGSYTATVLALWGSTALLTQIPGLVPKTSQSAYIPQGFSPPPMAELPSTTELDTSLLIPPSVADQDCLHSTQLNSTCFVNLIKSDDELLGSSRSWGKFSYLDIFKMETLWGNLDGTDTSAPWTEIVKRFILDDTMPMILLPVSRGIQV